MNAGLAGHAEPSVRQTHWIFRHRRAAGARGWVQQWPVDSEPSADTGRAGPYQRRRRVAYGGLFNDQRLHEPVAHQVPATVRYPAFYARFTDWFPGADRHADVRALLPARAARAGRKAYRRQ